MSLLSLKIAFVSPYVPDHRGGGEKYFFDCIKAALPHHQVTIGVSRDIMRRKNFTLAQVKEHYRSFLGDAVDQVKWEVSPLFSRSFFLSKLWWTKKFDVLYYITDGSLFWSLARKNILHIQTPLRLNKKSILDRAKLRQWQVINTNSEFTKKIIEPSWQVTVNEVHFPMIEPPVWPNLKTLPKEKIVLHVGRFFRHLHTKRQDVLVEFWRDMLVAHPTQLKGWKLILIGPVEDEQYAAQVARRAADLPIEIYHHATHDELWQYYQKASIYWHATGFGENEKLHPEKMEHFGISTVEAMTQGCVPIVIGKGGQVEVLGAELQDLLWQTPSQAQDLTLRAITDTAWRKKKAELAQKRAKFFSRQRFEETFARMITAHV